MAGFVVGRIRGIRNFEEHDIVELKTFDLTHVCHVDTGLEREVLLGAATKVWNLRVRETLVIKIACSG